MRSLSPLAVLVAVAAAAPLAAQAAWPQFRGPGGLCVADDAPIPARFGPGENVRWQAKVPPGASSPCIAGESVYLTGFEDGHDLVVALDRASGAVRWTKSFDGAPPLQYSHSDGTPIGSTPTSDGERVVVYLGNYGLVALDPAGKLLWEKRLSQPGYGFGVGTSPVMLDGMLVVARDGTPEAAALVLDPLDGSELLRISRQGFGESHGSPFLWRTPQREELVLGGNGRLCAYDPGTGERLWMLGGLTNFPCTTPTADADTLYYAAWSTPNASGRSFWESAFERSLEISDEEIAEPKRLFERLDRDHDGKVTRAELPECRAKDGFAALDADGDGAWKLEEFLGLSQPAGAKGENVMVAVARGASGDAQDHVRWTWKRGLPYVASPLLYRGRIWLVQSGGMVSVLDAKSGQAVIDRARLTDRSEYYVSPVGAAGHVLLGSAEGTLYVLAADAGELTVEHSVAFEDELFATPAVVGGVVYLRTRSTMWAFGATGG